jgi:hypothetical protein
MLEMRYAGAILPVLAIVLLGYLVLILGTTSSFKTCVTSQTAAETQQTKEQPPPYALPLANRVAIYSRCSGHVIYEYRDAATAVATVFIALFTLTLWWSTHGLLRHGREVERAYISAGGLRRFIPRPIAPAYREYTLVDTFKFEFHVNNYGKTPGIVFQIGWGFCERNAVPNMEPAYQTKYFDSRINPGTSGLFLEAIDIPQTLTQPAVYGRVYYRTIFGDRFSSGFLYWIPPTPGDSESIAPPNPRYTDEREES